VRRLFPVWALLVAAALAMSQERAGARSMQASDLARLPQPAADHVIAYGDAPQQVADLRLP